MNVLVTGGAGFIGSNLCNKLLQLGYFVTAIDNFDLFYAKEIKLKNISSLVGNPNFKFIELDISSKQKLNEGLNDTYEIVFHLAAKAGVLPSIKNPEEYLNVNITGTQNLLEFSKNKNIKKFIFASSSSVYGINSNTPWSENDNVLEPISPYAASKISGELIGKVYSHLYNIQFIALRFFTVYGPGQRPDLAIHKFTKMILEGKEIPFYGDGTTQRDYTYIDDIIDGIIATINYNKSPYEIINLGNNTPHSLFELVATIEKVTNKKALLNKLPMQQGDVPVTYANISKAQLLLNYAPKTSLVDGITKFYNWIENNHD